MTIVENAAPQEPVDASDTPSKSRRKAEAQALQALGAELVMLNREQLAQVDLPESLRDAVTDAQRIKSHEGRRRQLQYIGKLMRNVDAAPIRAKIDAWKSVSVEVTRQLHLIERWRDRLLDETTAIEAFAGDFPQADLQQVRTLIRNARREREHNQPPKSYRALFQLLKTVVSGR
ncbi:MAG: DUF615 domain-containing protein [Betaproteobacteria bacterium]|nr:DUF615 domain-containing protein [Betaproteobacteria bacterium]